MLREGKGTKGRDVGRQGTEEEGREGKGVIEGG